MTNRSLGTGMAVCIMLLISLGLSGGCQHMHDPFVDSLSGDPVVSTPSADAARAVQREHNPTARGFSRVPLRRTDGAVTHGPLYFEQPGVENGSDDGTFALTGEDYVYFVYGPARSLVNTIMLPVSALVTHPWRIMESDGAPSRNVAGDSFDAALKP